MTGFMEFPFVEVLEIGGWCRDCTHAARRLTRFSGPGHYCSANHPKGSAWQELHLRPPRSEQGCLLLTLHPENGCQTWTRTKTSGLTGRRATFTLSGNGAADRIPTCIVPFRRRMPHVFGHGSNPEMDLWMNGLVADQPQSNSNDRDSTVYSESGQRGRSRTCVSSVPSR